MRLWPSIALARVRAMSTRTYKDAIEHLNSLQSNAATLETVRASGGRLSEFAIPEMLEYLQRIEYAPEDLNKLNVLHVTGTKGKGSTCAFAESILRHAMPHWKTGLFTSPHLVAVPERIRINGTPISEQDFTKFFFEIWDRLERNDVREHPSTSAKPGYFRFITLVAFHAFLTLQVDATILEVGVGGTYDSTNIVPKPLVTGITALGIDHVGVLGKTLSEIAWQKGGIFKEGVPAFTVNQPDECLDVLEYRAKELKASTFGVVSLIPGLSDVKLGLAGIHQLQNANLAVHLAHNFLQSKASVQEDNLLSDAIIKGLGTTKWPARCQVVVDPRHAINWFLDGAHTLESLDCCMQWFVTPDVGLKSNLTSKRTTRTLIFNCTSGRSGTSFLGSMMAKTSAQLKLYARVVEPGTFFDHVIFCTNVTYADGGFKGDLTTRSIPEADLAELKTQKQLASAWLSIFPNFPASNIHVLPSIEHAVDFVQKLKQDSNGIDSVDILVTGSLHLTGGIIEVAGLSDVAL